MSKLLAKLFGNAGGGILEKLSGVADKFIQTKEEKDQFQKEMTERIIGKFGTSKYGRLSILTNYRLNIIDSFNISPNSFFPKPKVDSAILCFKPKSKTFCDLKNIENLEKITAIFFSNRRKMINKSLKKIFNNSEYLNKIKDIKLNIRPAELKLEKYLEITKLYERMNSSTFID